MSTGAEWRKTPEYKAILRDNEKLFRISIQTFVKSYSSYVAAFTLSTGLRYVFSKLRLDEFNRACADDLYRYAIYHPVRTEENEFFIRESVRASYISKWLMIFKPLILDIYGTITTEENIQSYLSSENKEGYANFYRKSNEFFLVCFVSATLGLKRKKNGNYCKIFDFLDLNLENQYDASRKETLDFLYTLRYRIPHQDVYRSIYRRMEAMSMNSNDNTR